MEQIRAELIEKKHFPATPDQVRSARKEAFFTKAAASTLIGKNKSYFECVESGRRTMLVSELEHFVVLAKKSEWGEPKSYASSDLVRAVRQASGLTQKAASLLIGRHSQIFVFVENGRRKMFVSELEKFISLANLNFSLPMLTTE